MIACARFPCGGHTGGCSFADCINNQARGVPVPGFYVQPQPSYHPPQMGCICPPTSEKTCESRICPRRDHSKAKGSFPSPQADASHERQP